MPTTYTLIAQDTAPAPKAGPQDIPFFLRPEVMILLLGMFFLIVILPGQRRQRREQQQMVAALKRGARVVTSSGIIGTVVSLKENEDEITIRSEDAKLKVLKSSVARVLGQDETETK